jgi:hypothetical protein
MTDNEDSLPYWLRIKKYIVGVTTADDSDEETKEEG